VGNGSGPFGQSSRATDWVAIILAVGLILALNLITAGVLYDAIFSAGPGLSENATQILTLAFGGIVGILGSYVGYRVGKGHETPPDTTGPTPPP
jgi:hypothetical protein